VARKPFLWRKLTPAQIDLVERISSAGGGLLYGSLQYREMVAFDELRKLGLAEMRPKGRSKLEAILTEKGNALRSERYETDQTIVRVTGPQIDLLRHLDDSHIEDSVGQPLRSLPGPMLDVCRRMSLRGWVDWYEGWNGRLWARLSPAGREVLQAVNEMDEAVLQVAEARRRGRLH
jgi:hypothetical protein